MADKKTILLTGGNTGIGLEACKILCSEGHKVVATVRSAEKGNHCLQEVKKAFSRADIHYMICDMSDPSSIRHLVEEFRSKHLSDGNYLDILINNAGMAPADADERIMCSHNLKWEITVAANCLGPIFLSDLLKDDLKKAAQRQGGDAMILMVGSSIILADRIVPYITRMGDIMMESTYQKGKRMPYRNSKVCLTLASIGLAEELASSNVAVHIMCPGTIPGTDIYRNAGSVKRRAIKFLLYCCCCITKPQSPFNGGMYIADIATHGVANGTSGKFWVRGQKTELPPQCQDKSKYSQMLEYCRRETAA